MLKYLFPTMCHLSKFEPVYVINSFSYFIQSFNNLCVKGLRPDHPCELSIISKLHTGNFFGM